MSRSSLNSVSTLVAHPLGKDNKHNVQPTHIFICNKGVKNMVSLK